MKQCSRGMIEVTKRCNWKCQTCFYRFEEDFNANIDVPISVLRINIDTAKERGCDHIVAVGWGEPALYGDMENVVKYCKEIGMTSSIISNGTASLSVYDRLYNAGMDHLHLSVHGFGDTINSIAGVPNAADRQEQTLKWLEKNRFPFRTNTTLQQLNYKELPEIMDRLVQYGSKHSVLLGFLPHYAWSDPEKMKTVAVHPAELRPYIEMAIQRLEMANVWCTLRYQPLCHLSKEYWKYVTNALYVLMDSTEWDYDHCGEDDEKFVQSMMAMNDVTSIMVPPCSYCAAYIHCGGWNRTYAAGFEGAGLTAMNELDPSELSLGYFFQQNPVRQFPGYFNQTEGANE